MRAKMVLVLTENDVKAAGWDDLHFSETERDTSKVTNPSDISTFPFPARLQYTYNPLSSLSVYWELFCKPLEQTIASLFSI